MREIWANRFYRSIAVSIVERGRGQEETKLAAPFVWTPAPIGWETSFDGPEPCLNLRYEEAQVLLDQLIQCGVRPSGDGVGAMAATERHLADTRRIMFGLLHFASIPIDLK